MRYDKLLAHVSEPRLSRYLIASNNQKHIAAEMYLINLELSGNLFKIISFFEVALRNEIDRHAAQCFPLINQSWLLGVRKGLISKSKEFYLTQTKIKEAISTSKDCTHNQILCQLSFGFWCSLFSGFNYVVMGSKIIKNIHPNRKINPKHFRRRMHQIRIMRNRIAHHEPIIFDRTGKINSKYISDTMVSLMWLMKFIGIEMQLLSAQFKQITKDLSRLDNH